MLAPLSARPGRRPPLAVRPDRQRPRRHGTPRVLVADDCRDTADSLGMLLGAWGYDARVAYGGAAAVAAAHNDRPDVILLDLAMPRVDGYEVARQVRRGEDGRDTLVIAVTGYADAAHREQALDAGCDLVLVKPVDPAVMRGLLARRAAVLRR